MSLKFYPAHFHPAWVVQFNWLIQLKDNSLTDFENLTDPDIIANEIIENLEADIKIF
jgi:hypothetical protein